MYIHSNLLWMLNTYITIRFKTILHLSHNIKCYNIKYLKVNHPYYVSFFFMYGFFSLHNSLGSLWKRYEADMLVNALRMSLICKIIMKSITLDFISFHILNVLKQIIFGHVTLLFCINLYTFDDMHKINK